MKSRLMLFGLALIVSGSARAVDAKKEDGKAAEPMACCVDKKECCADKKPCCSMEEGSWGEHGGKKDKGDWGGKGGWKDKGGEDSMGRMAEKLGLSEDQKTKLKALREKEGESRKAQREAMRAAVKALKEGVDKKAGDAELAKLIAGVEKSRNAMRDQEDKNVQEMKKILTIPQQAKAALFFSHKAQQLKEKGARGGKREWKKEKKNREREDEDEDEDEEDEEDGKEMKK